MLRRPRICPAESCFHVLNRAVARLTLFEKQEDDDHLLTVLRYVERNPLRATLCERAEDWKFGSLWRRLHGGSDSLRILSNGPIPRPLCLSDP